jgi:hypothetical protein
MEIGEAPPVADEASRFRGSGTIGATVTSEFTIKIILRLRTLGQPLAALLLYGCRIPLAGESLRRLLFPLPFFVQLFVCSRI